MNKKILIGSIIAVTVLIGVSFTSVVSYGSVKSTSAINSPLFGIRTRRAIGQGQQDITTDYLGNGEETDIYIKGRIQRAEQVQKAIDIISKMDNKAFSKFVERVILNLKNQGQMNGKETSEAFQILYNIRRNPNDIKYYDTKNNPLDETYEYWSCEWFPGCNFFGIIFGYIFLFFILIGIPIFMIGVVLSFWCLPPSGHVGCLTYEICK